MNGSCLVHQFATEFSLVKLVQDAVGTPPPRGVGRMPTRWRPLWWQEASHSQCQDIGEDQHMQALFE